MPKYQISAPDGNTYEIDGPEGASQDEVVSAVLAQNKDAGIFAKPTITPVSPEAEAAPTPQRSFGNRFLDSYAGATQYGAPGLIARKLYDFADYGHDQLRKKYPGMTDEWYESSADSLISQTQKNMRAESEAKQAADPAWRPDESFIDNALSVERWAPYLAGQMFGSAGPEMAVAPGSGSLLRQMGVAAGAEGAADVAYQGADIFDEVSEKYSPEQTAMAAGLGAGFQGILGGGSHLYDKHVKGAVRGVDEDGRPYVETINNEEGPQKGTWTRTYTDIDTSREGLSGSNTDEGLTVHVTDDSPLISTPAGRKGSSTYKEAIGKSIDEVADHVNSLTESWTNAPSYAIHRNFKSLKGVDNDAIAATLSDGSIVVNTERVLEQSKRLQVTPESIVRSATFHEGLGHYGLSQKFGEELDSQLLRFYDEGNTTFRSIVDEWRQKNPQAYGDKGSDYQITRAVDEILAEMSEKGQIPKTLMDQLLNWIKDYARQMGFTQEFSHREVKAILAQAHEGVIKGQKKAMPETDPRHMYAGVKSNLNSWPEDDARWFEGPDNMDRYEISDKGSTFDGDSFDQLVQFKRAEPRGTFKTTVGQLLDHPALFKAYPEIRHLEVSVIDDATLRGSYGESDKTFELSAQAPDPKSTLLHEIQHYIQGKEDFARGGNEDIALRNMTTEHLADTVNNVAAYDLQNMEQDLAFDQTLLQMAQLPEYAEMMKARNSANEWNKILWDSRQKLLAEHGEDDATFKPWNDETHADLMEKRRLADTEYFTFKDKFLQAAGIPINPKSDAQADLANQIVDSLVLDPGGLNKIIDRTKALQDGVDYIDELLLPENLRDRDRMIAYLQRERPRLREEGDSVPYQAYQSVFGEVEARDVQSRMDYDDEVRQKVKPYSSQKNISPEDSWIIHRFDTPQKDAPRYMKSQEKEDLHEAENALSILRELTKEYEPVVMTMEALRQEAEMRGLSPDRLLKNKALDLGELPRRFLMQDMAAEKLNETVSRLTAKMTDGTATYNDRVKHAQALLKFKELSARIFDEQGEAGRLLRVIGNLQYTKKKIEGLQGTLEEFTADGLRNLLDDPEAYARFAKTIQEQLLEQKVAKSPTRGERVANVLNIPRAIMSSFDLSAPFRQGLFMVGRSEFWKNIPSMMKYLVSANAYDELMLDITKRPTYPLMVQSGLDLSHFDGKISQREESFQTDLAQKIPIIGRGVKISERAYSGFLNKLRADVFDSMLSDAEKMGVTDDPTFVKSLGSYISHATGRGTLGGVLTSARPLLNATFFSPGLMASRIKLLNPAYYMSLHPTVRKEAVKNLLATASFVSTLGALGSLAGGDVELDPRSSDFSKIRIGDTRYDIAGGFSQYLTLGSRISAHVYNSLAPEGSDTHEYKTAMGNKKKYGNEYGQRNLLNAVEDFFYNKLAPIPSFVKDAAKGANAVGEPFELVGDINGYPVPGESVVSRVVPMIVGDAYEVMKEEGFVSGGVKALPALFGFGVQNFKPPALNANKEIEAPDSFRMEDIPDQDNENVTVADGEVILKGEAKKEWKDRLNYYVKEWMKDEVKNPEWSKMSDKDKAEILKEVRNDARKQAKSDMLELLNLEGEE